jgi:S1-C subfamily serine protease
VTSGHIARIVAVALTVGVAAGAGGIIMQTQKAETHTLAMQEKTMVQLQARVISLEARAEIQPDWTAVAAAVEPSVFTIVTRNGLGSGWVVRSDGGGSELLTNFHVVEDAWSSGLATVDVRRADRTIQGTVVRIDRQ